MMEFQLKVKVKVTQSCLTLCDRMEYTVHGILQARILQWGAFPFSRGSSQARDWTQVSGIAGWFFTSWATRVAQNSSWAILNSKRWCCESVALNMPANLENSAVAKGLKKVSFHSNPKERQCQRMLKLPHNCTHLTCQQSNAQISPS